MLDLDLELLTRFRQFPVGFSVLMAKCRRACGRLVEVVVALGILLILCAGTSSAQISPGPLARPHRSLEGTTQCVSCHKFGAGEATFKCLECHTEIASRMVAHSGHA